MAAPSLPAAAANAAQKSQLSDALKCSACGQTGKEFSSRQRNKILMLGEPARCKQCVASNAPIAAAKANEPSAAAPESNDSSKEPPSVSEASKQPETKERLYFSDGESISDASSSSDENNHNDVSLNALKQQILGRKLISPEDDDIVSTNEEEELPVIQNASQLRKELCCAICHEPFYQPLSLTCGHSFCRDCLQWWLNHYSKQSDEHGTCPTCRKDLICSGESLGVNTTLRAAVTALYGEELAKRDQAEKLQKLKATAGENGGAHDRGYEVLSSIDEQDWKRLDDQGTDIFLCARRSIVLDAHDARMQLALAVDCRPEAPPPMLVDDKMLQVSLCLLTMEEDEVADGGFPLTLHDEDDEPLISNEARFHSTVKATVTADGLEDSIVVWEQLDDTGTIRFRIPLVESADERDGALSTGCIRFLHETTGAEYEMKFSRDEVSLGPVLPSRKSRQNGCFVEDAARHRGVASFMDEDESNHGKKDEYEDDGFLVMNDEVEESASESEGDNEEDVCCVCNDHGELIVCDGGDHLEGCGQSFHIHCVGREEVPPGDWICGNCASTIDLDVGIEGHEFSKEEDKNAGNNRTGKENKRVLEESSGDESDESLEIVAPVGNKKKARIVESDSEED